MARKVSTSARRVTSTTPARRGGARKGSSRYLSVAFCARLLGSTTIKGSRAPLWRRWSRGFNKRACRFIYREVIEPIQKFNKYGAAALGATMSLDMMTAQTPSERDSKMSDWLTLAADIATPGKFARAITDGLPTASAQVLKKRSGLSMGMGKPLEMLRATIMTVFGEKGAEAIAKGDAGLEKLGLDEETILRMIAREGPKNAISAGPSHRQKGVRWLWRAWMSSYRL